MNAWERLSIGVTIVMLVAVACAVVRQPTAREVAIAARAVDASAPKTPCPSLFRLAERKSDSLWVALTRADCTLP